MLTPSHIKSDLDQLSDPYVREVYKRELFPNTNLNYNESSAMTVLNLAYYPAERGPYNLDPNLDADGHLSNPRSRWGGMMRRIDNSDFETSNIEYIEFWLMDPFIKSEQTGLDQSGDFYINLGEISEDVLRDGKKYSESAMPINASSTEFEETVWGRVPTQNSVTYAFNTSGGSRQQQDVGLNGLSSEQEQTFSTYLNYLQQSAVVCGLPFMTPFWPILRVISTTIFAVRILMRMRCLFLTVIKTSIIPTGTPLIPIIRLNGTARLIKPRLMWKTLTRTLRSMSMKSTTSITCGWRLKIWW